MLTKCAVSIKIIKALTFIKNVRIVYLYPKSQCVILRVYVCVQRTMPPTLSVINVWRVSRVFFNVLFVTVRECYLLFDFITVVFF